jgi:glycosyltransferase involved in cell wall biosynthesis
MKICAFATTFPRYEGDYLGAFVLGQLRELARRGHEAHIFAPHDPTVQSAHDELMDGVYVHRAHYWLPHRWERLCYGAGIPHNFRSNPLLGLQLPSLVLALANRARPYLVDCDIVHGHWSFGGLAALLTGKRLVLSMYGAEIVPSLLRPVNRLLAQQADAIIVISRYTGRLLQDIVPDAPLYVIPYAFNAEKLAPTFDVQAFKQAAGLAPERPIVLGVGRLVRRKGFDVLVEAAQHLDGEPYVLIGGRGPEYDDLQARIREGGGEGRVRMLGYIDDAQLAKWYAAADVFVLPAVVDDSGDTEGLGMVLVEAMFNGTPVVGSAAGGITDIVKHEESGLLAPPGDAEALAQQINRLLTQPALYEQLAAGGRRFAERNFSWDALTDRLLEVYTQL